MAGQIAPLENLVICPVRVHGSSMWDSVQRACDVALIIFTLPVWAPLLLAAMGIKLLLDGGPVLFRHVRLGHGGEPFVLYKLRTTPADFQPSPGDWSNENYPPRTRYGSWLRRFDIDELPQLWNVLKGEMSLVGPRPEMPVHARRFSGALPEYPQRLTVRPGLTGLAQVRGWRGDTSIRQRLVSDLEYANRRGPGMYFAILAKTVAVEARRAAELG
ncbi:MAG TPA: sugar transferase [Bryobacteraceae bacterium]|nr:sugar transferase [Bryobacteraceae bacterium]